MMINVPIRISDVEATVGWDPDTNSYFFIAVRTSVSSSLGAPFDSYLRKRSEIGDIYWAGGHWSKAPAAAEHDMRDPIPTITDLIHWTWDHFDWPAINIDELRGLCDVAAVRELVHISETDTRSSTTAMSAWTARTLFPDARPEDLNS